MTARPIPLTLFAALILISSTAYADSNPQQCVGDPPRQLEDPLSPPCVPFYEGPHPATWPGVEEDEVRFVLYNDVGVAGDLTEPWTPEDENPSDPSKHDLVRTLKAQLRYFQARMQTYSRFVRVIAVPSTGTDCAARSRDATAALLEHDPFGAIFLARGASCFIDAFARASRVASSFSSLPTATLEQNQPFAYSFLADTDLQARASASFMCHSLVGRHAVQSGDPSMRRRIRTFGLLIPSSSAYADQQRWAAVVSRRLARQCGRRFDAYAVLDLSSSVTGVGMLEAAGAMASFRLQRITTVVCACPPVPISQSIQSLQRSATAIGYSPEWYFDSTSGMDIALWHQRNGTPGQQSFGTSSFWRQPAMRHGFHYMAYLQEEPGTIPNTLFNFEIYHSFLMAFVALQGAGPDTTPGTIEQSMYTWNWTVQTTPWTPTGGYGDYGPKAVSQFAFVDTGLAWWWDGAGTPPDGQSNEGCVRVSEQGARHYPSEWPRGQRHLFDESDPCSGELLDDSVLTV